MSLSHQDAVTGLPPWLKPGSLQKVARASLASEESSAESRQPHQIVLRSRLQRLPGLAPGGQAADDHERVEAFFLQQMRHPGACPFARSSTVEVNVLVFGEILDLLFEIVGLDAN